MEHESALGFLAAPDEGPSPGVVMVPDVWGLADHTRDLARRLAAEGFAVLAVDPYRKTGRDAFAEPAEAMAWISRLSDPLVLETLQEAIDHLAGHSVVGGGRVGITGFCMGGQYTVLAGGLCTGLSACAPFYGMLRYADGLDPEAKPRQPLDVVAELRCPFMGFYGGADAIIPVADVDALREVIGGVSQPAEVHLYPEAGHAFMNDSRPAMYVADAAADAWRRLVPFLREHLGRTGTSA